MVLGLVLLSSGSGCETVGNAAELDEGASEVCFDADAIYAYPGNFARENERAYAHEWTVTIIPLGEVDDEAIDMVRNSIEAMYGWKVLTMARHGLPQSAWYEPRKRYRAEKILSWLRPKMPRKADRIMALTKKDISTTKGRHKDWGICGLADLGERASVVSTFRIQKRLGRLSLRKRQKAYLQRLKDLAAHEFGHQLGLDHCPLRGCIMEDAKGTVVTFNHSSGDLCSGCRYRLAELGF